VSLAEAIDIQSTGVARPTAGAMEGKWFAETYTDATKWGGLLYDGGLFAVVTVVVEDAEVAGWFRLPFLDNIGPARWAEPEQFSGVQLIEVAHD
jgi:hypothetical protein